MKALFLALSLLVSFSCFAKRIYTLPKSDFIAQFSDTSAIERIYCYKQNGEKVWLIVNDGTLLVFNQNDGKKKKVLLNTIKYRNGIVDAVEVNSLGPNRHSKTFDFSLVSFIEIAGTINEMEIAYFDDDSCRKVWKYKNDSLLASNTSDSQFVIHLVIKKSSDTLTIIENACYHLKFKDNSDVEYGVVQKITRDSIYISNRFNKKTAEADKVEYKVYGYPVKDISEVRLLHSGGFYYKKKNAEEWDAAVVKVKSGEYNPSGFRKFKNRCEIDFVRLWLTNSGFRFIYEKDGKVYWYGA